MGRLLRGTTIAMTEQANLTLVANATQLAISWWSSTKHANAPGVTAGHVMSARKADLAQHLATVPEHQRAAVVEHLRLALSEFLGGGYTSTIETLDDVNDRLCRAQDAGDPRPVVLDDALYVWRDDVPLNWFCVSRLADGDAVQSWIDEWWPAPRVAQGRWPGPDRKESEAG